MSKTHFTLREMVELVNIPENSLKRYMQEHEEFILFDKEHNRFRIHASAVEPLKLIRRLYGDGLKKEEVHQRLIDSGEPVTIVVSSEDKDVDLVNLNEELTEMKRLLQEQMDFNQQQMKFNAAFVEEFQSLKKMVNQNESKLIGDLRESLEYSKTETDKTYKKEIITEVNKTMEKSVKDILENVGELNKEMLLGEIEKIKTEAVAEALEAVQKADESKKKGFFQRMFSN